MTAYTLAANINLDSLSPARTGGDTVATAGFTLTIDQDTRGGLGGGAGFSLGSLTITATSGGNINIDARAVRWIAYTGGAGNVPAWNTLISNNGASGKLIGVYASLTTASTATGAAMPATGFIKVKQVTGTYAAGALTGITATASGADKAGWIEVVGDEAATINANRLGQVNITGEWFELGTTSGVSNQTLQIPNNGLQRYAAGVFIEKTAASNNYEFYPNAGTATTTGTEAARGKCVWIDNTGLVRIGNSGAATNGYTPPAGLKVVIGNIFLENCTTAARTANVIPNATIATRYDFTCTGGGVVTIDKANCAWYASFAQPFAISLNNAGFVDQILLSECASAINWSKIGVGNKPTTALVAGPLSMSLCQSGGAINEAVLQISSLPASSNAAVGITDCAGFTFNNCTVRTAVNRANATTYTFNLTRASNCQFDNPTLIGAQANLTTCDNITFANTAYIDGVSGTTQTTLPTQVWQVATGTKNFTFSGLTLPVTNNQPYTALMLISPAGCTGGKLRNIGTRAAPLNLGSTNQTGLIYQLATGAAARKIKVQRVYCSNTRNNIMTADNSSNECSEENVFGDYADSPRAELLNFKRKGGGCGLSVTALVSVYGSHVQDTFTSLTAGRIQFSMNEATALTTAEVTLTNSARFTSAGGLIMPAIGDRVVWETPYFMLGHTGFQNVAPNMNGGTIGNYTVEFALDKNNGAGFSAYQTANAANLSATSGIDPAKGFKMRVRLTTSTTNTAAITSLFFLTNSSAAAQDNQYPLDTYGVTLTGLQNPTEVRVFQAGTQTEIGGTGAENVTTGSHTFQVQAGNIDISILALGYQNMRLLNYPVVADASIPISQVLDRQYLNP